MNRTTESKALREVREWKATCNREVAGMEIGAAVRKRLKDSEEHARRAGFAPMRRMAERVAETGETYDVGRNPNPVNGGGE